MISALNQFKIISNQVSTDDTSRPYGPPVRMTLVRMVLKTFAWPLKIILNCYNRTILINGASISLGTGYISQPNSSHNRFLERFSKWYFQVINQGLSTLEARLSGSSILFAWSTRACRPYSGILRWRIWLALVATLPKSFWKVTKKSTENAN